MYAEDKTNFGVCDNSVYDSKECFLQILTITRQKTKTPTSEYFEDNYAYISASSIFGGLLDRCTVRDSTNIHYSRIIHEFSVNGITYLTNISNINVSLSGEISSEPIKLCFCQENKPDGSYQPPPIKVQINDTVDGTTLIHSSPQSLSSGLIR